MTILAIVLLISLGILLILLEFFVVPGVTIAGIGGLLMIAAGIWVSFSSYGTAIGAYTLMGTVVLVMVILFISFKTKTWDKIMLKAKVEGTVDSIKKEKIKVGDLGVTITRLAPIGKAQLDIL